jgi:hypothetical protein
MDWYIIQSIILVKVSRSTTSGEIKRSFIMSYILLKFRILRVDDNSFVTCSSLSYSFTLSCWDGRVDSSSNLYCYTWLKYRKWIWCLRELCRFAPRTRNVSFGSECLISRVDTSRVLLVWAIYIVGSHCFIRVALFIEC